MNTMNTLQAEKTKIDRQVRTFRPILAASGGDKLPTKIELLKVGMWDTPNHGMFMVTPEDLNQYKENFDNGVAQAGESGIVIDFDHDSRFGKSVAAGWITGLEVGTDDTGIPTLFATVEWTGLGKKELLEKNYKCISPEFYPESRGGWEDPEEFGHYIPNVLAAAGLVNRPLFKGLKPIMASATSGERSLEDKNNVIYISASEKGNTMPTLDEVRIKDATSLTEEEKTFLVEHKTELTAEEQGKFGFEVTAEVQETEEQKAERLAAEAKAKEEADAKAKAEAEAAEAARNTAPDLSNAQPVMASAVKGDEGKVVMAASDVKALYDFKRDAEVKATEDFVKEHVARGAIVASETKKTVDMLIGATGSTRDSLKEMITKLPSNSVVASEAGSSEKAGDAKTATEQIKAQANAIVASAKDKGETVDIGTAMSKVMKDNPELAKQYQNELVGKE
jgi:hypothetical protein